jgi:hypothetical protein
MTAETPAPLLPVTDDSTVSRPSLEDGVCANSHEGDGLFPSYNARTIVGKGMDIFTATINDNIIAARYGVFATVALLTVSKIFSPHYLVQLLGNRIPTLT